MHIHILGIGGTFMAGLALLAREAGFTVSGSDANVYPPMSTQLAAAGIRLSEGYEPAHLHPAPDVVVVGNVMSRGQPLVEYLLNSAVPYTSGPAWLAEHVLRDRWVLAVAGTHGKTTVTSMLAWIMERAGLQPGFLIGGIAQDFGVSARYGNSPFFVVEADEYDTAFFDKRSKFVHYRPRTLVLNNLEFDHADIFPDLAAIQRQFHHLIRTVPGSGKIISHGNDANLAETLALGCWTPVEHFVQGDWQARAISPDGSAFDVVYQEQIQGRLAWTQLGSHNVHNALAAIAAAHHAGVPTAQAISALAEFKGVKRRLELRGTVNGIQVYDDFAHHPTAIATTLAGLRARQVNGRIIAVLEPRSNTMRLGVFKDGLAPALAAADRVVLYQAPDLRWPLDTVATTLNGRAQVCTSIEATVAAVSAQVQPGDVILIMSNGGFGGIHERLLTVLADAARN
ncbi:MAG: UDP-N-acetylmuramate:L-alanyl-gamma-D-glutamyl-meso-diaminopimelate ligase [Candidatus Competibacteraceae bacterium]